MKTSPGDRSGLLDQLRERRLTWGPFYYAVIVLVLGVAARYVLASWSTLWVVLAAVACALAPASWAATRLRRKWRRRWGYLCLAAGVTWIGLVHAGNIDGLRLAVALLVGTLVLGIPWWTDKVRRDKVRVEGELNDWDDIAKRVGLSGTRWVNHREQPGRGWTAQLEWPAGMYDRDEVIKKVARIEAARDLPAGSLRLIPHGRERNRLDAIAVTDDPHTEAIEWPGPAKPEGLKASDPIPLGLKEDQSTAEVERYRPGRGERRILVGGASDSGKSGALNHFVGEDACRDDVAALNIDLKGGLELSRWAKVAAFTASNVAEAVEVCAMIEAAIKEREALMKRKGWKVWKASPEYPVIHVNIDEIRELAGSTLGRTAKQAREMLDRLIQAATQGRAVGIGLLMAGQLLTIEATGSSQVRAQFDIRLCFRMQDRDGENYVMPGERIFAEDIPEERPGTFYLKVGEKLDRMPIRMYFWPDELVDQVAELRAGANAYIEPETEAAMAAVSPMFAAHVRERDGIEEPDNTDGMSEDSPDEVPPWNAGPDVPLSAVVRRHEERTGSRAPDAPEPDKSRRLSDEEARDAMWRVLHSAGPDGASAKELRVAAGRSSSWLHPIISEWCDDPNIPVKRSRHGRYVLTPEFSTNGHSR